MRKSYEDFITTSRNVKVADEQLKQALQNYDQAFGEYKVGKGDILSVVFAETLLAQAGSRMSWRSSTSTWQKLSWNELPGSRAWKGFLPAAGSEGR